MALTYEPIAKTTLASSTNNFSFSSISSAYTDLIVVFNGRGTTSDQITCYFNSDSSAIYSYIYMQGDGTTASAGKGLNLSSIVVDGPAGTLDTNYSNYIFQFPSYSNTNVYKNVLTRFNNASVKTGLSIGLWKSTAAINTITFFTYTTFQSGSTFTLYGIKAA